MSVLGKIGLTVILSVAAARAQSASTQPIAENMSAVHALLKSKRAEDRWRGVNMLAEAKSPEAAGLLICELDDEVYSGEIRTGWGTISVRAIELLGRRRDTAGVEPLIRMVQRGPVPSKSAVSGFIDHTADAAQSLGWIGDRRAVPVLTLALAARVQKQTTAALKPNFRPHSDPFISSSIEALGRLGDARALPPLMKIVSATYSYLGGPPDRPPTTIVAFTLMGDDIKAAFEAMANLPGSEVTNALTNYLAQPAHVTESNANSIRWATEALSRQKQLPTTQP